MYATCNRVSRVHREIPDENRFLQGSLHYCDWEHRQAQKSKRDCRRRHCNIFDILVVISTSSHRLPSSLRTGSYQYKNTLLHTDPRKIKIEFICYPDTVCVKPHCRVQEEIDPKQHSPCALVRHTTQACTLAARTSYAAAPLHQSPSLRLLPTLTAYQASCAKAKSFVFYVNVPLQDTARMAMYNIIQRCGNCMDSTVPR